MKNTYGNKFKIRVYGGSHTKSIRITFSGLPSDFNIDSDNLYSYIKRRQPRSRGTTTRIEQDIPHIKKNKNSISIVFYNKNINDNVYSNFNDTPRPSHADYTQLNKYGDNYNIFGGGMASGRMTLLIVTAGAIAEQLFKFYGLTPEIVASITELHGNSNKSQFEDEINTAINKKTSIGAIIECVVKNLPKFIGEPFFDSVESEISKLAFSIPGIKGIEFGDGFECTRKYGHERNDVYINNLGETLSNNEGGINGGISNGNDIVFRVAVKPTASIFRSQSTYNFKTNKIEDLKIKGRHDVCFALRTPVIIESIAAIALIDLYMQTL